MKNSVFNLMKYMVLMTLLLGVFSMPLFAKAYKIPEHYKREGKVLLKNYEANPSSNKAKFDLAMYYGYTGQIEKGWGILKVISPKYSESVVTQYEAKVKENPKNWRYHFKLAFGYYFTDQKKKAVEEFEEVSRLDPNNAWVVGYRALIIGEQGDLKKAVILAKKAVKMQPNSAALRLLLAEGYRRQGNLFGAMAEMMIAGRLKTEASVKKRRYYEDIP